MHYARPTGMTNSIEARQEDMSQEKEVLFPAFSHGGSARSRAKKLLTTTKPPTTLNVLNPHLQETLLQATLLQATILQTTILQTTILQTTQIAFR